MVVFKFMVMVRSSGFKLNMQDERLFQNNTYSYSDLNQTSWDSPTSTFDMVDSVTW